jgi:hypothetical protein
MKLLALMEKFIDAGLCFSEQQQAELRSDGLICVAVNLA